MRGMAIATQHPYMALSKHQQMNLKAHFQGEMQMLSILETLTILFGIAFFLGFLSRDFQAILNPAQPKTDDVATETPKASPEVSTSPGEIPSS
jgi:hypothetical protein